MIGNRTRHVGVVCNPRSGRPGGGAAEARRRAIGAALAAHAVQTSWFETTRADPGHEAAARAVAAGADLVLACGGDGTVMACASALLDTGVPLGIIPGGTGNIIATSLGLPTRVVDAVEVALHGSRQHIDLGATGDERLFFIAGIGFSAAVLRDATPALKSRTGMLAYLLSAARHTFDRPAGFRVWLDDRPPITRLAQGVLVGNYGEMMRRPLVRTGLDDGALEIGILRVRPLLDLARPDRRWPPLVDWYQAGRVRIECDRLQPTERDGDWNGASAQLEVNVRPRVLEVCAPGPAMLRAPRQTLSQLLVRDLGRIAGFRAV
ncbi:diacylglycerol/lipid kinase family protein [Streptomyces violaceus]|uniref:diacylglycerol/lipid kinase family protein n=1 Tax=Streptomyces violaceus TaxID=1936 RepID=UPI00381ED137